MLAAKPLCIEGLQKTLNGSYLTIIGSPRLVRGLGKKTTPAMAMGFIARPSF